MPQHIETIIVGGGQAGLALSYYLTQRGREHIVLERAAQPAHTWRNERWDSFTLVSPNWYFRMPGAEYDGPDPDGYMPRAEVVRRFEDYVQRFDLPVQFGVDVTSVEPGERGYRVRANGDTLTAANVVVATGSYQAPKFPPYAAELPRSVLQLHSSRYRNPDQIQPGGVLVIGTGQSGCQIAEELYLAGRDVFLSVGTAGRFPRRYRGKDIAWWLNEIGFWDETVPPLPPQARNVALPHVSGTRGGHTLNLHQFARDGVTLVGRASAASGGVMHFAEDLQANVAGADALEAKMLQRIDAHIAAHGLDAPDERPEILRDAYALPERPRVDLKAAGITNVIWACGYACDYSWVKLPVFDETGFPVTQRGVTAFPGLYFLGMHMLHSRKSGVLIGIAEDAAYVAEQLGAASAS
jgi:putative flavoprotein involved in K+ transport